MKRDIDLARQLLFDIEAHGANCALNTLRTSVSQGTDERVRYHLRLLIDAGMVKELERTNSGLPCVRLTNAGHELIELARNEGAWIEAKQRAAETGGGQSLTVVRAILAKWAVEAACRRRYRPSYQRVERPRRYNGYYVEREPILDEERIDGVRPRPDYRERLEWRDRFDWRDALDRDYYAASYGDYYDYDEVGVSLPVYIV